MYKKVYFILLLVMFSCSNVDNQFKIEKLKKENDSLKSVLTDINNKYVFDSISFRDVRSTKNTYEKDSEFEETFYVVAYGANANYFVKYDSIVDGKKINPDTLSQIMGGFKYKCKLINEVNDIHAEINIENKYGKSKYGALTDRIYVKK